MLNQNIGKLEDLGYFHSFWFIVCYLIGADYLKERIVEGEDYFYQDLGYACFNQNLLDLFDGWTSWGFDLIVVGVVYFANEELEYWDEGQHEVIFKTHEKLKPLGIRIAVLLFDLGWCYFHHLHEGLLWGEDVGDISDCVFTDSNNGKTVLLELKNWKKL